LPPSADPLIMIPDMNLAQYIATQIDRKIVWHDGYCPIHHMYTAQDVLKVKAEHPDAVFAAHPECRPEVLELADHITSTSGMYTFARESDAQKIIVGTEMGVLYKMRLESPGKTFIPLSNNMICPNMKLTKLADIRDALINMEPVITVDEDIRIKAKLALDRMLAVPRD
jgi:quinolinate synthase